MGYWDHYQYQIQRVSGGGFNLKYTDVSPPSRNYKLIKEVRAAAREYLVKHGMTYPCRDAKKQCIAVIYRGGEEIDYISYDGYYVTSAASGKCIGPSGSTYNPTSHDGGRW